MNYHTTLEKHLNSHILEIKKAILEENPSEKVNEHLNETLSVKNEINGQRPEDYRKLIEYLYNEGRRFGWSYSENPLETKCETSFWNLNNSIKKIIQSITLNERLYFFGYLNEYEKLNPEQRSKREHIEHKLFLT